MTILLDKIMHTDKGFILRVEMLPANYSVVTMMGKNIPKSTSFVLH